MIQDCDSFKAVGGPIVAEDLKALVVIWVYIETYKVIKIGGNENLLNKYVIKIILTNINT